MDSANWHLVVLPYVEGTLERIARVMRKHQVLETSKDFQVTTGASKG